jgi:hypothetical protein
MQQRFMNYEKQKLLYLKFFEFMVGICISPKSPMSQNEINNQLYNVKILKNFTTEKRRKNLLIKRALFSKTQIIQIIYDKIEQSLFSQ